MGAYILRRLLLMIPTLFGIMALSFLVVQFAPGGPVEEMISRITNNNVSATAAITGGGAQGDIVLPGGAGPKTAVTQAGTKGGESSANSAYRGSSGLSQKVVDRIVKQFGFDKPPLERFVTMLWNYARFDFGRSYFRDISVLDLIKEKLPVSITLGLWMTLLSYGISIPLGIMKAVRDGSRFDVWTSTAVIIGTAIPSFLFAILLIVLFAGGSYLQWFPLRGLVSDNWAQLDTLHKVTDYFWHLALPVLSLTIGSFASLTLLTNNSFLDQINQQYVLTARAKGLSEARVLYRHVFRNAMLIVISGIPSALIGILFTGALLIEVIFSIDGLGLLGFQATVQRDYPVMFGTLYMFTLLGLVIKLIEDLTYVLVDPRIDFERR